MLGFEGCVFLSNKEAGLLLKAVKYYVNNLSLSTAEVKRYRRLCEWLRRHDENV